MLEIEDMKSANAKRIAVVLSGGPKSHPTAGYRLWAGTLEATEPIVALHALLGTSLIAPTEKADLSC